MTIIWPNSIRGSRPETKVSCGTCHAGRTDPRRLPDVLWEAYEKDGIDDAIALAELARIEPTLDEEVLSPGLLDSLAWRLNRSNREASGHALIEANYARFPRAYTAVESMAFILADTGREQEAFAVLESWVESNPDHARARRLLVDLKSKTED